jgi:hypothetical protein
MGSSGSDGKATAAAADRDGGLGATGAGLPAPSAPGSRSGPSPREFKPSRAIVLRTAPAMFRTPRHQLRIRSRRARRSLPARSSVYPPDISKVLCVLDHPSVGTRSGHRQILATCRTAVIAGVSRVPSWWGWLQLWSWWWRSPPDRARSTPPRRGRRRRSKVQFRNSRSRVSDSARSTIRRRINWSCSAGPFPFPEVASHSSSEASPRCGTTSSHPRRRLCGSRTWITSSSSFERAVDDGRAYPQSVAGMRSAWQ